MSEAFINSLVDDLPSKKPIWSAVRRTWVLILSQIIALGLVFALMPTYDVGLDFYLIVFSMLVSSYIAIDLSIPGRTSGLRVMPYLFLSLSTWLVSLLYGVLTTDLSHGEGIGCGTLIAVIGFVSGASLSFLFRKTYVTRPFTTYLALGSSHLLLGSSILQLICPGSAWHFLLWHFTPFALLTLASAYLLSVWKRRSQRKHGLRLASRTSDQSSAV